MTGHSEFHYRPTVLDLVEAVREFLAGEVMAGTDGPLRYNARIATRLLATVARELGAGAAADERHRERLRALGYGDDAELAAAVRAGQHDDDLLGLLETLAPAARARLQVANPGYLDPPAADS